MKFLKIIASLVILSVFSGCPSSTISETSPFEEPLHDGKESKEPQGTQDTQTNERGSTLMDRYISGEIPGFTEE